MDGWPSRCWFNYDYQSVNLSEVEFAFLEACDANSDGRRSVGEILAGIELGLDGVRSLLNQQLILLSPA